MVTSSLKTILYVDDEDDIRTVAVMAMEIKGLQVTACQSGKEAIEICAKFTPDLLLLDVMMPEIDGPATLAKLKQFAHLAKTPVVFMTAKTQKHEVDSFKRLGAIGVITKPFDPITLGDTLAELWQNANTPAPV